MSQCTWYTCVHMCVQTLGEGAASQNQYKMYFFSESRLESLIHWLMAPSAPVRMKHCEAVGEDAAGCRNMSFEVSKHQEKSQLCHLENLDVVGRLLQIPSHQDPQLLS